MPPFPSDNPPPATLLHLEGPPMRYVEDEGLRVVIGSMNGPKCSVQILPETPALCSVSAWETALFRHFPGLVFSAKSLIRSGTTSGITNESIGSRRSLG